MVNEGEVAAYVPAGSLQKRLLLSSQYQYYLHGESVASNPLLLSITKPTASVGFQRDGYPWDKIRQSPAHCHCGL